ncbi:MAG: nucleotidyltransferase family protein [Rhodocyclaceae bacterium]|nr:nucleotidyltransferase family protein [Rhodocyclaceae bacterium]
MTPEQRLLRCAASALPAAKVDELLRDGEFDWTVLVQGAFDHGVSGLLCSALMQATPDLMPHEIRGACAEHLRHQGRSALAAARQMLTVLDHLKAFGIEAIPFKGPTLAVSAFGALGLRSLRDLDFLIRKEQTQSCLDALRELGYTHERTLTPHQWQAFLDYAGEEILFGSGLPIEPHWHFAPRTLSFELDYEALWSRARPRPFLDRELLCLAPEDELLAVCLHGGKEQWVKLKWVADVAAFVERHPALDWAALQRRASAQGVARVLRLGLALARNLLDAPLPAEVTRWVDADPHAVRLCGELHRRFFEPRQACSIYEFNALHWHMRERAADRWRYLVRTLTQPRTQHFTDVAIPDRLFGLYVPYKVLHDYAALPLWRRYKRHRTQASGPAAQEQADAPS